MKSISESIKIFFQDVDVHHILLFTTFTFDEIVLKRLLEEHNIHSRQKIIVFYEVMKHRNPGYLRNYYPNVRTIAVQLDISVKSKCPIFHAKIWASIQEKPFKIRFMALHSFNLSQYHLGDSDQRNKTYELISVWKNVKLRQPKGTLFDSSYLKMQPGDDRVKIVPQTMLLNGLHNPAELEFRDSTVERVIMTTMKDLDTALINCAAPFIHRTPITSLTSGNDENRKNMMIWTGARNDGTQLHLKILELQRYLIIGSANLTKQAFGMTSQRKEIINYEALGLINKPKSFKISKQLKGFTKLKYSELDNNSEAESAEDPDDKDGDWQKQKEAAIEGPLQAYLSLRNNSVELCLNGEIGKGMTHVALYTIDNESRVEMKRIQFVIRRFRRKSGVRALALKEGAESEKILQAMLQPPLIIKGLSGKNVVWHRELDLGQFWIWLDRSRNRIELLRKYYSDERRNSNNDKEKLNYKFMDVRNHRARLYAESRSLKHARSHGMKKWNDWVNQISQHAHGMPKWCRTVIEETSERYHRSSSS